MAFWGCEVKPGKATPFVPPPESSKLHLSQACLSTKAKPGCKAALLVKVDEGQPLLVCSLREGGTESLGLDLIFDKYTEFLVEGAAPIHLTGYFMPEYEMGGEEEESEEEDPRLAGYPAGQVLGYDEYGVPVLADEYDSEEDSDYESEDDEDMDDDDEDDSDMEPPSRTVVIEDVTESEQEPSPEQKRGGKQRLALPAPEAANGKAADFSDDDVDASDDEEGSEDDSEGEEEETSESEDDDEAEAAEAAAKAAAAQKQQQKQAAAAEAEKAGQKRKAAEQPATKQPQQKQQKQQQPVTPASAKQQQGQQSQQKAQQQQQAKQQQATPAAGDKQQQQQKGDVPASAGKVGKVRHFPNGFEIEELKMGRPDGKLAKAGKKVVMKYVGKLKSNGKVFDQTKGNATFPFRLGVGEVIKGWDRGVEGMRVGDRRRLTIPPQMAYGSSGVRGAIPPNAWLVFEVELVDVK